MLDIAPLCRLQARGCIPIRDDAADSHIFSTGICKEIALSHPRILAQQFEKPAADFSVDLFVHGVNI